MSTTVTDPLLGRLLDGRYEIRRRLAAGGMATVYSAVDTRLDRPVAVKVMHPALAADEEFVARFRREAKAAARLSSPTVVNVTDQGQDGGTVFLVMELVEGRTLRDLLRAEGALPPAEALAVLDPVLEALAAAHAAGYVHRDVKPENVLLADDGRIKVGDFGLARAVDASPLTATTGLLLGTVAYLAPEQVRRGVADARTDVYASGVLLFEVLTGRPPFEGDTALSVAYQHLHDRVPPPSSLRPEVPDELDELVLTATEPDPDNRPIDAQALLDDVRHVAANLTPVLRKRLHRRPSALIGPKQDTHEPEDSDEPADTADAEDLVDSGPPEHHTARFVRGLDGRLRDLRDRDRDDLAAEHDVEPLDHSQVDPDDDPDDETDEPSGRRRLLPPAARGWLALLLVTLLAIGGVWYLAVGRGISIPRTAGLTQAAAEQRLRDAGFTPFTGADAYSETAPRGAVADTDPSGGSRTKRHARVALRLSLGPERYTLLPLRGQSFDAAVRTLRTQKLAPGAVSHAFDDDVPAGSVISTDPAAGAVLKPATEVALQVSDGPAPVTAPNVVGQTADQAEQTLTGLGLRVQRHGVYSDNVPSGQVIDAQPNVNLHRKQQITLSVSLGPQMVEVPNVVGQSRANAIATLEGSGFRVRVLNVPGFDSFAARVVPSAGSKVRHGSTITVVLA